MQAKLTPTQKKRKFTLGDVFLGLQNGNFGTLLPGWHDHGSISAIDVNSGRRVWKFTTPEPERGGVTTTAGGVGFAGGGDGVLRAFDVRTGKVLWTFQTGAPIAAGRRVYSVGGKEYVAITVGGTPTSSNGGTAEPAAGLRARRLRQASRHRRPRRARLETQHAQPAHVRPRRPRGAGRRRHDPDAGRSRRRALAGELVERRPCRRPRAAERRAGEGRTVSMDGYRIRGATRADGSFRRTSTSRSRGGVSSRRSGSARDRTREAADGRPAQRAPCRVGRLQHRLRDRRPARAKQQRRQRVVDRAARRRERTGAADSFAC